MDLCELISAVYFRTYNSKIKSDVHYLAKVWLLSPYLNSKMFPWQLE